MPVFRLYFRSQPAYAIVWFFFLSVFQISPKIWSEYNNIVVLFRSRMGSTSQQAEACKLYTQYRRIWYYNIINYYYLLISVKKMCYIREMEHQTSQWVMRLYCSATGKSSRYQTRKIKFYIFYKSIKYLKFYILLKLLILE